MRDRDSLLPSRSSSTSTAYVGHQPLQRLLERARVVESDAVPADVVTMNSQVVLRCEASGERRVLCVVYPPDADPAKGLISVLAPTGTALLGATPGRVIDCDFPEGLRRARVEEVLSQPEHSLRTQLFVRG